MIGLSSGLVERNAAIVAYNLRKRRFCPPIGAVFSWIINQQVHVKSENRGSPIKHRCPSGAFFGSGRYIDSAQDQPAAQNFRPSEPLAENKIGQDGTADGLAEQTDELARLIKLASTPIAIELESDELTEVTVYRVGPLGAFAQTTLELRPGTYTAIGSRDGFRDVRTTFTILPGKSLAPIRVACIEPI